MQSLVCVTVEETFGRFCSFLLQKKWMTYRAFVRASNPIGGIVLFGDYIRSSEQIVACPALKGGVTFLIVGLVRLRLRR